MNRDSLANLADLVEAIWHRQLDGWEQGQPWLAESIFDEHPELLDHPQFAVDVLFNEAAIADEEPEDAVPTMARRFPQLEPLLLKQLQLLRGIDRLAQHDPARTQLPQETPLSQTSADPVDAISAPSVVTQSMQVDETHSPADRPANGPSLLADRFEIAQELGRGTTAVVWKAWDRKLEQQVALKQLHPSLQESSHARARLLQEARALTRLHHAHIIPCREIVADQDHCFLVAPFIAGRSLQSVVKESPAAVKQAVQWILEIAEALHYAHEQRVIHRDVKPANVIIDHSGRALLTDFGLASTQDQLLSLTQSGEMVGTPAYMAPEQINNRPLDGRCDIYALGSTLFYLLTGSLVFSGSVSSVLQQILTRNPPPLRRLRPELPKDLERVVDKCLGKDAMDRYPTAQELAEDLRRFLRGEPVRAEPIGVWEKASRLIRRRPGRVALAAGSLVALAFLAGAMLQVGNLTQQRNRAIAAEEENGLLLSSASFDAGELALLRGEFRAAIPHFKHAIQNPSVDSTRLYLKLVECHLAVGEAQQALACWRQAANHCLQPEASSPSAHALNESSDAASQSLPPADNELNLELVRYWKIELEAHGVVVDIAIAGTDERIKSRWAGFHRLDPAKLHFLAGMNSQNSVEAHQHFRDAVAADPGHYGARRLSLIMALSLARFDELLFSTALARERYPDDLDFQLFDALAHAGTGALDEAQQLIARSPLSAGEKKEWGRCCSFLDRVTQPASGQLGTNELAVIQLVTEFLDRYLPLFMERRWRFPPRIATVFAQLPNAFANAKNDTELRQVLHQLADVHPEGTLLWLAADAEIKGTGINPVDQLVRSRDRFHNSAETPAFFHGHSENAWRGVYANAVALALVHGNDVEVNRPLYVEAIQHIRPRAEINLDDYRTIAISLFAADRHDLAKPFIEAWLECDLQPAEQMDAHWYQALYFQRENRLTELATECRLALSQYEQHMNLQQKNAWLGLSQFAENELRKLLDTSNQPSAPVER